jgi:hypothetical protein
MKDNHNLRLQHRSLYEEAMHPLCLIPRIPRIEQSADYKLVPRKIEK